MKNVLNKKDVVIPLAGVYDQLLEEEKIKGRRSALFLSIGVKVSSKTNLKKN